MYGTYYDVTSSPSVELKKEVIGGAGREGEREKGEEGERGKWDTERLVVKRRGENEERRRGEERGEEREVEMVQKIS